MFVRRQPWWFWIWLGWFAVGLAFGVRSWLATDLSGGSDSQAHPGLECSPCLSGNGQVVAYEVSRPGSAFSDLCIYDLVSQRCRILGREHNESSQQPRLDEQGRLVAFASFASDWVKGDANSVSDIFVYDLTKDKIERVLPPEPVPGVSSSYRPSLSRDGNQVAFLSYGVPDSGTIRGRSLCLWQRDKARLRVIPDTFRGRGPALGAASFSPRADRLAFSAFAGDMLPNLRPLQFDIYLVPIVGEAPWPPPEAPIPLRYAQGLGGLTRWAWSPNRLGPLWPVALLSHQPDGGAANANSLQPVLLENECLFTSLADNLVAGDNNDCHDIFVRSLTGKGETTRLTSGANDSSFEPAASLDGRFVAFTSYASNLVKGDVNNTSDVFWLDRRTGRLECLTLGGNGASHSPSISSDGQRLAFVSQATNLTPQPGGAVYVWTRGQGLLRLP